MAWLGPSVSGSSSAIDRTACILTHLTDAPGLPPPLDGFELASSEEEDEEDEEDAVDDGDVDCGVDDDADETGGGAAADKRFCHIIKYIRSNLYSLPLQETQLSVCTVSEKIIMNLQESDLPSALI